MEFLIKSMLNVYECNFVRNCAQFASSRFHDKNAINSHVSSGWTNSHLIKFEFHWASKFPVRKHILSSIIICFLSLSLIMMACVSNFSQSISSFIELQFANHQARIWSSWKFECYIKLAKFYEFGRALSSTAFMNNEYKIKSDNVKKKA